MSKTKRLIAAFAVAVLVFMICKWPDVVGTIVALTFTTWLAMTVWSKYRWKAIWLFGAALVLLFAGFEIVVFREEHIIDRFGSADYAFGYWAVPPKSAINPPTKPTSNATTVLSAPWQRFVIASDGVTTVDQCDVVVMAGRPAFNTNCPMGTLDYFDSKAGESMGLPLCEASDLPLHSYETSASGEVLCYSRTKSALAAPR